MSGRNAVLVAATLKGKALICAIDAGLVPEASDGEGYNIAPFLRFWEMFEPLLKTAAYETDNSRKMLN